jgi:CubicO group peptidase (beta-lactamase class C family)
MVLGAIIESVSGQTYETYITQNVLQPLGMSQTGFVYTPAMAEHEAAGTLPVVHFYTPLLPTLLDPGTLIRERQGKLLWLNRVYIDATPSTGLIGARCRADDDGLSQSRHLERAPDPAP